MTQTAVAKKASKIYCVSICKPAIGGEVAILSESNLKLDIVRRLILTDGHRATDTVAYA